jgi:hypothetical protein
MYFREGKHNALEVVRSYHDNDIVDRYMVECALDFFIMIEPDHFGEAVHTLKFAKEISNAKLIIRRYGERVSPLTLENLQNHFYSFSNDRKYRYSAETISVVRTVISTAWEGLAGWLD